MLSLPHRHHRCTAWLALFAMLCMALLPSVSHALTSSRGDTVWTEFCTPQGMRMMAVAAEAASDSREPASAAAHLEHGTCCSQSAATLGMPPAAIGGLPLPVVRDGLPALFLQAPQDQHVWRSAQPRAPPAIG